MGVANTGTVGQTGLMPAAMNRPDLTRGGGLRVFLAWVMVAAAFLAAGCVKVKTEVEPIDINVNVRLEVDRELDKFFEDLDAQNPTLSEIAEDTPS